LTLGRTSGIVQGMRQHGHVSAVQEPSCGILSNLATRVLEHPAMHARTHTRSYTHTHTTKPCYAGARGRKPSLLFNHITSHTHTTEWTYAHAHKHSCTHSRATHTNKHQQAPDKMTLVSAGMVEAVLAAMVAHRVRLIRPPPLIPAHPRSSPIIPGRCRV